ncbi:MAG: hypothetical protein IT237_03615 [Bacteroidia bacterium]|nr:hypothetical protein [Bacteroidia bacterium]
MASNIFVKQGIELDTLENRFRKTYKILKLFSFTDGWNNLPKLNYILLFKTLYAKCESCSTDDFENSSIIQLSLVYNKNRKLIIHESKNLQEITQMAHELSKNLSLKIRDSATDRRNPVWITN